MAFARRTDKVSKYLVHTNPPIPSCQTLSPHSLPTPSTTTGTKHTAPPPPPPPSNRLGELAEEFTRQTNKASKYLVHTHSTQQEQEEEGESSSGTRPREIREDPEGESGDRHALDDWLERRERREAPRQQGQVMVAADGGSSSSGGGSSGDAGAVKKKKYFVFQKLTSDEVRRQAVVSLDL